MPNLRGYYENAKNYASDSDNQPQTYAAAGLGPTGYAVGYGSRALGVGKPGAVEESLGITNQKGNDLRGQMDAMSNSYWNTMGGYSNQMTENNKNYLGAMSGAGKNFVDASSALENQYQGQIGQLGDDIDLSGPFRTPIDFLQRNDIWFHTQNDLRNPINVNLFVKPLAVVNVPRQHPYRAARSGNPARGAPWCDENEQNDG